jgi:hypothetical protein
MSDRERRTEKLSVKLITQEIHDSEGDLTIAAKKIKISLRKLLHYVSTNFTLRGIMDEYAQQNRILAQNKLERAVKNDETWAILHTLKQEETKLNKPEHERIEENFANLDDRTLINMANGHYSE